MNAFGPWIANLQGIKSPEPGQLYGANAWGAQGKLLPGDLVMYLFRGCQYGGHTVTAIMELNGRLLHVSGNTGGSAVGVGEAELLHTAPTGFDLNEASRVEDAECHKNPPTEQQKTAEGDAPTTNPDGTTPTSEEPEKTAENTEEPPQTQPESGDVTAQNTEQPSTQQTSTQQTSTQQTQSVQPPQTQETAQVSPLQSGGGPSTNPDPLTGQQQQQTGFLEEAPGPCAAADAAVKVKTNQYIGSMDSAFGDKILVWSVVHYGAVFNAIKTIKANPTSPDNDALLHLYKITKNA